MSSTESDEHELTYTFDVVNMVGSGRLPVEVDTEVLSEDLTGTSWKSDNPQPGLYYELSDGPMVTFYKSGKYIIRADGKDELYDGNEQLLSQLKDLEIVDEGVSSDELNFDVVNVVSVMETNTDLNLNTLSFALGLEHVEYEPEQFPALFYRRAKYPCTFLLFGSGKIVCPGASSIEESKEVLNMLYDELTDLEDFLTESRI